MSVRHALLALLSEGPKYGLQLREEFEARTGEVWPLNVGQVYTTLQRLERDGFVASEDSEPASPQKSFVITDDGRKIILHWLTAGRIFGGAAIVSTPMRYLLSTELVSDSCALVWERQAIRNLASRCPKLLDNALSLASTELIPWLTAAHISLSSDDAQGRVAHLLESLASAIGRATPSGVEMSITNEDLAEGANVTPFTVSRCLSDWQSAGIVVKRRGKLLLRKPELLLGVSQ